MTNKIRDLDVKLDIISKLLNCIEKYPEERIGQILDNSRVCCSSGYPDLFCIEDKKLLQCINKRIKSLE